MSGNLIIISAPSGTGKTTILKRAMEQVQRLAFSVSHTTRHPRLKEQDGRDYFFVTHDAFEKMIGDGQFLEWAHVHDNYYGTAVDPIKEKLEAGFDVVLDIDVQGTEIIRQRGQLDFIDIFIAPPNAAELEKRLRQRGTEDEKSVATRLANSVEEMGHSSKYRYLIVNDRLEDAVITLCSIIYAMRAEGRRGLNGLSIGEYRG